VWLLLVSYRSHFPATGQLNLRHYLYQVCRHVERSPEDLEYASFSKTPTTSFFIGFHGTQRKAKDDVFAIISRKREAYYTVPSPRYRLTSTPPPLYAVRCEPSAVSQVEEVEGLKFRYCFRPGELRRVLRLLGLSSQPYY